MANEVEIPVSLDTKALLNSIAGIEKGMSDLSKSMQSNFEKSTKAVNSSFEKLGSRMSSAFAIGNITANLANKAIEYLGNTIQMAVAEAINFQRALLEIETILPKGTSLTKQMVKQLEDLSVQFGTTPTAQAKSYYEIISAGVENTADATDLLINANKLATGGLADITGVIDTLTTVYSVYGREVGNATDASDSLFKTVQLGKTTMPELQADIGRVLPIAKTFGLTLDEVGSAMVLLTNSGLKTREAVSYLTALLVGISRNGKELGSTMNSTAVQTDGFGVVMQRLAEKTKGSNDALIKLVGTSEGVRAVQALNSQGVGKFNQVLGEYSQKAGVAEQASKKIISGDLSKQFDIFTQSISRSAREIVGGLIPAFTALFRSINDFKPVSQKLAEDINVEGRLNILRKKIAELDAMFDKGTINSKSYGVEVAKIRVEMEKLANGLPTAQNPLIAQTTGLKAVAQDLTAQINSLKLGFDGIKAIGPMDAFVKAGQLEEKLKKVNAQIAELSAKKIDKEIAPITPQTDEQKKLEQDIKLLNANLLIEQENYNTQSQILADENIFARKEKEINATYDLEFAKLQAIRDTELAKTEFIAIEEDKRLAQAKINADFALKAQTLAGKTSLDKQKELANQRKIIAQAEYEIASNFLQAGITLSTEGSAIQKGLLITQATMNTYAGANKVLADPTIPTFLVPAMVASIVAMGLANVAKISGAKFATGGIVGGNHTFGDRVPVNVNSQEMILTRNQQAELFQIANGSKSGDNSDIKQMVMGLIDRPIVVNISGREIARVVREESRSGFNFA